MTKTKAKIDEKTSIELRHLHQTHKVSAYELVKRFGHKYAERSIYRHAKKPLGEVAQDKRKKNLGRPKKLSARQERMILRAVQQLRRQQVEFTSRKIQETALLGRGVSNRDIRRCLNAHGFSYRQSRKKGLLSVQDKKNRLKFARQHVKLPVEHWTESIAFYLDGVGFAHKSNPAGEARSVSSMAWRRPQEGLTLTTKGRKEGSGGKMCNFFVAIAHSHGVVMCHHHEWRINGANFANKLIKEVFPGTFEICNSGSAPASTMFLQDGCPSQNARVSEKAWESLGYKVFKIPARSPDLNPIENLFNLVRKKLKKDAIERNIRKEDYKSFMERVRETIKNMPVSTINNLIESMPKRLSMVTLKGGRTKY